MAVNGKSKGNSQERKLANLFSKRFEYVTGIPQAFRRNPDSGSFWGATNQKRIETHDVAHAHFGDLICPDNFKFSIESKFYKSGPTFSAIIKGKITQWDNWIAQAKQDAINSKKEMMLIIKYNGVDEIVFLSAPVLSLNLILPYKDVYGYLLEDVLALPDNIFFNEG
jgi:hypothetical protein